MVDTMVDSYLRLFTLFSFAWCAIQILGQLTEIDQNKLISIDPNT